MVTTLLVITIAAFVLQQVLNVFFPGEGGRENGLVANWFALNGIELWAVNENPDQKTWTHSPKAFANAYIDDAAIGCPLRQCGDVERPFIDWNVLSEHFVRSGIITVDEA